ncbi:uncharacterized protein LOC129590146 isoform X2 [Paramacrobiotus metropolitanus]|uniref:uncharacterized protein LOC129590146 isoform X2 n=1 Tax=Paramacrobiotus metropolitanus TaxID=2943436 RepID=UPI00244646BA|nr:uncharacterized protein LOC129590146 isoform X2 [Paramacrobiotus metropolitanus]
MLPTGRDYANRICAVRNICQENALKSFRTDRLSALRTTDALRSTYPVSLAASWISGEEELIQSQDDEFHLRDNSHTPEECWDKARHLLLLDANLGELSEDELDDALLLREEELQATELKILELEPRRLKLNKKIILRRREKDELLQRLSDFERSGNHYFSRKPNAELYHVSASYNDTYQLYVMSLRRHSELVLMLDEIDKVMQKHCQNTSTSGTTTPTMDEFIESIQSRIRSEHTTEYEAEEMCCQTTNGGLDDVGDLSVEASASNTVLPISLPKAGLISVFPQSLNQRQNRIPPLNLMNIDDNEEATSRHPAVVLETQKGNPKHSSHNVSATFRRNRPVATKSKVTLPVISSRCRTPAACGDALSDSDF